MRIEPMKIDYIDEKAYVHYKTWKTSYQGLISQVYLDNLNLEKMINIAKRCIDNCYVAILDNRVVGFINYGEYRFEENNAGEIEAIYVLPENQGIGIGKLLMEKALSMLNKYNIVHLWVLENNLKSIKFYESMGFILENIKKEVKLGETTISEIRMKLEIRENN